MSIGITDLYNICVLGTMGQMLFVVQAHPTHLCALPTHTAYLICRLEQHVCLYWRLIQHECIVDSHVFVFETHTTHVFVL